MTAAAAKSLQLWPTLCDPIDGSPPASPVPGILQARTLEWVAISFSNMTSVFIKGEIFITEIDEKMKAEIRMMCLQAKNLKDCQKTTRTWETGMEQIFLQSLRRSKHPADILILDF